MSEKERRDNFSAITSIDAVSKSVQIWPSESQKTDVKQFTFDSVFDHNSTQIDVYNGTARKIVESVLDGFNGTVFVYGNV